ncbi:hypothetical protein ID875_27275 [Streptomyces globisporus]|uniref:Galactosyltransferase C-terminal domain-containing protein n=1 Tax=Streptomyces globisporus TaxID=1908 RepID=A0A927GP85_STRGL|nr:hypothetical protein [Streptomyces globisporus]
MARTARGLRRGRTGGGGGPGGGRGGGSAAAQHPGDAGLRHGRGEGAARRALGGLCGANTSLPRALFEEVGGFDEGFGLGWGCEDLELGVRALAAGHTWWSRPRRPGCTSPTRAPTAGSSTRPTWTVSPPCTACARYGSCPGCSARAGEWRPTWRPAPERRPRSGRPPGPVRRLRPRGRREAADRPYAASRTQEVHVQRRGAPVRRASTRAKGRASRNMPRTCDSYISAPRSQSEKSAGSARSR